MRTHVLLLLLSHAICAVAFMTKGPRMLLRPAQYVVACSSKMAEDNGIICITKAEPPDYETVLDLTMRVFFGELGSDFGFNGSRKKAFAEIRDEQGASLRGILADPLAASFKASLGEMVVGFITCSDSGVLTNLAVDPSARRQRVGSQLVERLLATGPSRVDLEVDWDNEAAQALYKTCGFVVIAEPDDAGARYKVDWWKGKVKEDVFKVVMRYDRP